MEMPLIALRASEVNDFHVEVNTSNPEHSVHEIFAMSKKPGLSAKEFRKKNCLAKEVYHAFN